MYLNLNRPYHANLPRYVNVNVCGFSKAVYEIEKETGLILDANDILKEITDCIKDRMSALVELDLYCLSLIEQQCHSDREDEVKQIIRLFIDTGKIIYDECVEHGLYTGNTLGFVYNNSIMDNLVFIERNSMIKTLHEEFNPVAIRYPAFIQARW